jgi:hypothetical protein
VTTPPPKGGGFSLGGGSHRAKAESQPENVAGSVGVSVIGMSAHQTQEHLPGAVVGRNMPAFVARSGRVAGVDQNHLNTGTLSLVLDHVLQHPPTRIKNRAIEPRFLGHIRSGIFDRTASGTGHVLDLEVFQNNDVVGVDQSAGSLVQVIPPLVADSPINGSNPLNGFPSPVRTAFLSGEFPLDIGEPIFGPLEVTGILGEPAIGVSEQVSNATVDPDNRSGQRPDLARNVGTHHVQIPVVTKTGHRELLDRSSDWTVEFDLHMTDALHPHPVTEELSTVTIDKSDGIEPPFATESRIAGSLPGFDPTEERLERSVQPTKGLLFGGERPTSDIRISRSNCFQLGRLVTVPNGYTVSTVSIPPFLQGSIVDVAMIGKHHSEVVSLLTGGEQPVPECPLHDQHFTTEVSMPTVPVPIPLSPEGDSPLGRI